MASGEQNITALPVKTNTGVANSDYFMGIDSAEGYQILIRDVAKYIMENYNGSTLAGQAQTPKAAIDALNSNISSLNGGVPIRKADAVAAGGTFTVTLSNTISSHEGFALLSVNVSGNALAGCVLLYLGRGTSKISRISSGGLSEQSYSASYNGSNSTWTITNNTQDLMYFTAIISK